MPRGNPEGTAATGELRKAGKEMAECLSDSGRLVSSIPTEVAAGIRRLTEWKASSHGKTPLPSGTATE